MKLLFKRSLQITIISLGFLSPHCYAGWPEFDVLSAEQVQSLIVNGDCPQGYGKIPLGTQVEIHSWYIPHDQHWYWVYSGDGKCHPLSEPINYLSFKPNHGYSGESLTAHYGISPSDSLFTFAFTIPPGPCADNSCPWYCAGLAGHAPPSRVACAFDMQKD